MKSFKALMGHSRSFAKAFWFLVQRHPRGGDEGIATQTAKDRQARGQWWKILSPLKVSFLNLSWFQFPDHMLFLLFKRNNASVLKKAQMVVVKSDSDLGPMESERFLPVIFGSVALKSEDVVIK
jgi:hypothetical protein